MKFLLVLFCSSLLTYPAAANISASSASQISKMSELVTVARKKRRKKKKKKLDPKAATNAALEGDKLLQSGDSAGAEGKYHEAMELDPNNILAMRGLGEIAFNNGRFDESAEFFKKAIKADPTFAQAYYSLGYALRRGGKYDEAAAAYKEFITRNPSDPDGYYGYAESQRLAGHLNEAATYFDKYAGVEKRPSEQEWVNKAKKTANKLRADAIAAKKAEQEKIAAEKAAKAKAAAAALAAKIAAEKAATEKLAAEKAAAEKAAAEKLAAEKAAAEKLAAEKAAAEKAAAEKAAAEKAAAEKLAAEKAAAEKAAARQAAADKRAAEKAAAQQAAADRAAAKKAAKEKAAAEKAAARQAAADKRAAEKAAAQQAAADRAAAQKAAKEKAAADKAAARQAAEDKRAAEKAAATKPVKVSRTQKKLAKRLIKQGDRALRGKKYGSAKKAYLAALKKNPNSVEANFKLGIVLAQMKNYAGAVEQFQQVLRLDPNNAGAKANLEHARKKAAISRQKSGSSSPAGLPPEIKARSLYREAVKSITHRKYRDAIVKLDECLRLKHDFALAYVARGSSYIGIADYRRAIAEYEKASTFDPSLSSPHYGTAEAYRGLGNKAAAIKSYRKYIQSKGRDRDPNMVKAAQAWIKKLGG